MPDYKKPYFQLFCIICDTIEELEQLLADDAIPAPSAPASEKAHSFAERSAAGNRGLLIQE